MLKFSACELESTLFTRQQEKSIIKQSEHLATIAKSKIQSKLKKEDANKLDKDTVLFWKLVSILETIFVRHNEPFDKIIKQLHSVTL